MNPSYRYGNQLEYEAGHFGYPMYGAGSAEQQQQQQQQLTSAQGTTAAGRKLDAGSKWVEFDKSPDTEKTLLEDSKPPSTENDVGSGSEKVIPTLNDSLSEIEMLRERARKNAFAEDLAVAEWRGDVDGH